MEMAVSLFTPVTSVLRVIQTVHDLTKEHRGIWSQLKLGVRSLGDHMKTIEGDIATYEEQELQELAYDIEDFLHGLTTPVESGFGFGLTVLGRNPGEEELRTVGYFLDRIDKLQKRQESKRGEAKEGTSTLEASSESSGINHDTELVGNATLEFEELLSAVDNSRLSVISIVGSRGSGKTALAWAVYKATAVPGEFDCKAWVVASDYNKDSKGLLNKILEQISKESAASRSSSLAPPAMVEEIIYEALQNKRYLVVIDDMLEQDMWDKVESAFPGTAGSRIVVTTSIQPIAAYLGGNSSNGHAHQPMQKLAAVPPPQFQKNNLSRHRYTMPYLDIDSSRKLLHQKMGYPSQGCIEDENIILRKCDGLPLTLVSVANHLRWNQTRHHCRHVAQSLGSHIAGNEQAFGDLKRTLVQCYDSLPGYQDRRCLLSVGMFPQGHQINMKSLLRKWIAEGLVAKQCQLDAMNIACHIFDRSIIDPVLIANNSHVKRCQVNGTMLEFIVYNSTCATNFATVIHPNGRLPTVGGDPIRRLFVWDGDIEQENKADVIRWLTLCPNARFDISKCRLLLVLDVESCKWIDKKVLESICKLVFLKYLSLRDTDVSEIPEEIQNLVKLETLDIRGTKVNVLPINVVMMPGLVHLFGKFELVPHWPQNLIKKAARRVKGKVLKKVKPQSKLETLAGVNIDKGGKCFNQIMVHSEKLKKVKIWCNKTGATDLIPLKKFGGKQVLESLSVDCSEPIRLLSGEFLKSLSGPCAIKSLKLRGELKPEGLPVTQEDFMKLQKVVELQLFSTGLSWEALSVLHKMHGLLNLKLAEDNHDSGDEIFIVQEDGFQGLRRLCIQAPRLPKVQFMKGAMPCLISLELLQTEAMPEVTISQLEAPLPPEARLGVTILQLEAPLEVGVTSEISSSQPETLLQTGETSEVSTRQPAAPPNVAVTSEITSHRWLVSLSKFTWTQICVLVYIVRAFSTVFLWREEAPLLIEETAESEHDLGVEGLSHLVRLNEVILHHSAPDATVRGWKAEAKKHINRPHVKKTPFVEKQEPNSDAE